METQNSTSAKRARARRLKKAIQANYEAKRRELGMTAPALKKGPKFYLGIMAVMAILGVCLIDRAGGAGDEKRRDIKVQQAISDVSILAEALGRFKFHCGTYPTAEEGLVSLTYKYSRYPGWLGPYVSIILPDDMKLRDPWKHEFIYEPTNDVPVLISMGPDGVRGTADDITPDAALFQKAFHDTSWTNDWVHFTQRGIIVVPSDSKKP